MILCCKSSIFTLLIRFKAIFNQKKKICTEKKEVCRNNISKIGFIVLPFISGYLIISKHHTLFSEIKRIQCRKSYKSRYTNRYICI